jgi:hypothetical protein
MHLLLRLACGRQRTSAECVATTVPHNTGRKHLRRERGRKTQETKSNSATETKKQGKQHALGMAVNGSLGAGDSGCQGTCCAVDGCRLCRGQLLQCAASDRGRAYAAECDGHLGAMQRHTAYVRRQSPSKTTTANKTGTIQHGARQSSTHTEKQEGKTVPTHNAC